MRTLAFLVVFGALAVVAGSYMLQRPSNLPLVEPSLRAGSNPQPLAPSEQLEAQVSMSTAPRPVRRDR